MSTTEFFEFMKEYFPRNPELMTSLKPGAIWEYVIKAPKLDDQKSQTILTFHLIKREDETLELHQGEAPRKPDLILYFTERAILNLISGFPSAKQYYKDYRQIMNNPTHDIDLDYKINKPRLKLWRLGYRAWSKLYKFTSIQA
jgi:hypothetical protein